MRAAFAVAAILSMLACAERAASSRQARAPAKAPIEAADVGGRRADGYTSPRTRNPACVAERLKMPIGLAVPERTGFVFKFAVLHDGRVIRFSSVTPGTPLRLSDAVLEAVESCEWQPGQDPEGRPVAMWVMLPLRFVVDETGKAAIAPEAFDVK